MHAAPAPDGQNPGNFADSQPFVMPADKSYSGGQSAGER